MQLKVGDFVRNKALGSIHKCTYINGGEFNDKISTIPSLSFDSEYMSAYELWSPRVNEWVWHELLGNLCQYRGPIEDSDLHSFYVPNFNHPNYSVTCASDLLCEPFIGTLPSYIKG